MLDVPADIIAEQCVKAALNYSRLTEGKKRGLTEIHFVGMETDKLLYIQQELQLLLVTKDFAVTAGINKSESGRTANLGADSLFAEPSKIQNSSFHELQDDGKRQTFTFGNKVIRICKGDIFTEKASAIVVTTDEMGNGGSLKSSVDNQIAVECRDVYNRKFAQMIGRNPRLGNIFILDGYSCGYDCIISIVFPSRAQKGPLSQRRRSLRHIFSTLFQMVEQDERIQSVVTCLFGINDKTEEDLQLWSNAFMDSFIKGSSPLDITIVCKNIAAYKVICEFCNQTTKSFNTERNEMGNFSNLSDVNQMQMRKAFLDELDDDPVTRSLYDKVIREGLETDTTVRVMLIGCFGQGKTTLARRLQGQHLQNITSTDGIEVHRCISKEDEISCTWTLKDNENDRDVSKRLATVALKEIQGNSKEDANKNNLNQTRPCFQSTDEIKSTVNNETLLDYADNNVQSHKKETTEEPLTRQGHQNLIVTRINPTMEKKKTYFHSSNTPTLKQHKCKLTGEFRKALEELKEKELQPGILKTKKINVWDFGGQYIYYATHQLFHSKYAVYLLVFNLTVALDEEVKDQDYPGKSKCKTMKDYINFWMHSIHSFVGSSDGKEPVVILVGTHRDKLKSEEEAETYFEAVRELFASSTLRFHIYFKHFALSLFDEDEKEINDLRRSILQVGERRENQIAIPVKWILLEDKLKGHEQRNIISFADLQIVDKEGESPIGDETELKMFLKFQHAKGIYFYFDEGLLSSHVVLNPQYVIDAFKSIIKSKRFCLTKAPELVPFWMKLSCEATLVAELLHGIWKNSSEDFIKHEDVLLLMLKKHRIIAEVLIFGNKTDVLSLQPQGYFIVPSLLKRADEGQIKDFLTGKRKSTVSFVFCFDYSGTVETIFHRLMATAIGTWPILSYGDIQMVFDNGGIFEIDSYHAALMKLEKGNIQLLIVARCYNKDVLEGRGDYFRRFAEIVIKQEFRKLKQYSLQLETNLPYEMKLQCFHVEHKCAGSKNLTTLKAIQNFQGEIIPCPDNYSHNLLRNQIEMDWFKRSDTEDFPKREITNKEYSKLAQAIGESWETLGIRLGVNRVAIQHIKMKNLDPVMKIYEMLLKWKELNAGRATLKALVKQLRTLPEDTVNWDIVYNMKDNFF